MESKISFGFKNLPKKPAVIGFKPPEQKKVELIECLDQQSIKIIGHVQVENKPLVIPMQQSNKNLLDRIKEANDLKERSRLKYQKKDNKEKDSRPDSELTIEELAARKLLEDAQNFEKKKTAVKVTTIAIEDQLILEGGKEPTMDDYEAVPISDYGYAMLRGMGWSVDQVVGNKKVDAPELRPKGMGLGAAISGTQANKKPVDKDGKELKLVKDAKAKIIAGKEKGNYCIVQGLDDDAGRVIVRTTLAGAILSLNEFMLFPVSNEEYAKYSKILNNVKYEKFKDKEVKKEHKREHFKVKEENNGDVEFVPIKNGNIKIEVSSDSEMETRTEKVKVKSERRSRSKSISRNRDRSDYKSSTTSNYSKNSKSRNRSRSRTRSKDKDVKQSKKLRQSSSSSRDRKKSRSRSTTRSKNRKDKLSKNSRSRKGKDMKKDHESDVSSDSEEYKRSQKMKSKKAKKHKNKKEKKHKKKSRSRKSESDDSYK